MIFFVGATVKEKSVFKVSPRNDTSFSKAPFCVGGLSGHSEIAIQ
jgi:hypothetical protein